MQMNLMPNNAKKVKLKIKNLMNFIMCIQRSGSVTFMPPDVS